MFPPRENLPRAELAPGVEFIHRSQIPSREVLFGRDPEYDPHGNGPALCNYGWGFTYDFVEKYSYFMVAVGESYLMSSETQLNTLGKIYANLA